MLRAIPTPCAGNSLVITATDGLYLYQDNLESQYDDVAAEESQAAGAEDAKKENAPKQRKRDRWMRTSLGGGT